MTRFPFLTSPLNMALGGFVCSTLLLGLGIPEAIAEPSITFNPPAGTRLSNFDAFLTITINLDGDTWETLPYNWQEPTVRLNGQDISLSAQSLLSGATASVLTPDKIVVSSQAMTADTMVLSLSGLRLDPGFNRLVLEVASTDGGEPLFVDVSYPVIAGQDQATSGFRSTE